MSSSPHENHVTRHSDASTYEEWRAQEEQRIKRLEEQCKLDTELVYTISNY